MVLWAVWGWGAATVCRAQKAAAPQQADPPAGAELPNSALLDDLLDLLAEPAQQSDSNDAASSGGAGEPTLRPADVGLDGEDLGESAENPLISVKQSMLIAAGWLQRGKADPSTQQLQRDIVTRLDELIEQLEQSRRKKSQRQQEEQQDSDAPQSPQQRSQQSSQEQRQQQSTSPRQSDAEAGEESPDQQRAQGGQSSAEEQTRQVGQQPSAGPGEQGPAAPVRIDLGNPLALQEGVWGQLPEQLRKQMQSRMVEQFHPTYRRQIEAYFQALLKIRPPQGESSR